MEARLGRSEELDPWLPEAKGIPVSPRGVLVMPRADVTHEWKQSLGGPGMVRRDRDGNIVWAQGFSRIGRAHQRAEHHQILGTGQGRAGNRDRVGESEVEALFAKLLARSKIVADELLWVDIERLGPVEGQVIGFDFEAGDPESLSKLGDLFGSAYPLTPQDLGPWSQGVKRPVLNRAGECFVVPARSPVLVHPEGLVPSRNPKPEELQRAQVAALERDAAARLISSFTRSA